MYECILYLAVVFVDGRQHLIKFPDSRIYGLHVVSRVGPLLYSVMKCFGLIYTYILFFPVIV